MATSLTALLRADLPVRLRHSVASRWLKSLLLGPHRETVLGSPALLQRMLEHEVPPAFGVAIPTDSDLGHYCVASLEQGFQCYERERRDRWRWWVRHAYDHTRFSVHKDSDHSSQIRYRDETVVETLTELERNGRALISSVLHLGRAVECILNDAGFDNQDNDTTATTTTTKGNDNNNNNNNATTNNSKDNEGTAQCCRLHYDLAPFQTSVATTSANCFTRAQLLVDELKLAHITCLPWIANKSPGEGGTSTEPLSCSSSSGFVDEDSLGVCFNVVVQSDDGEGFALVRNRDTDTAEHVKLTSVTRTLAGYMKTNPTLLFESVEQASAATKSTKPKKQLVVVKKEKQRKSKSGEQ